MADRCTYTCQNACMCHDSISARPGVERRQVIFGHRCSPPRRLEALQELGHLAAPRARGAIFPSAHAAHTEKSALSDAETYRQMHRCTDAQAYRRTGVQANRQTGKQAYAYTCRRMHTNAYTRIRTQVRRHAGTQAHQYAGSKAVSRLNAVMHLRRRSPPTEALPLP